MEVLRRYANLDYQITMIRKTLTRIERTSQRQPRPEYTSQPHPIKRRLGSAKVAEVVADYQAGATCIELADKYAVSKAALLDLLHEHGLAKRKQGLTAEQCEEARMLRQMGESYATIGQRFGVYGSTVWRALTTSRS